MTSFSKNFATWNGGEKHHFICSDVSRRACVRRWFVALGKKSQNTSGVMTNGFYNSRKWFSVETIFRQHDQNMYRGTTTGNVGKHWDPFFVRPKISFRKLRGGLCFGLLGPDHFLFLGLSCFLFCIDDRKSSWIVFKRGVVSAAPINAKIVYIGNRIVSGKKGSR